MTSNVQDIETIKTPFLFGRYDYSKANDLLQRTKMLSEKIFLFTSFISIGLIGIKFEPVLFQNLQQLMNLKWPGTLV